MPRGLVEVDVDADHEVELAQRRVEAGAVGRRQHRVAGDRDQRADPALAGGVDLLGQAGDRELAEQLGEPADAAGEAAEARAAAPPGRARGVGGARRGGGNIAPPGRVEVAGEDVDHVDQPAGQRAELLGAGADPAVHGGASARRRARGPGGGSRRRRCRRPARPLGRERRGQRRGPRRARCRRGDAGRARRGPRRTASRTIANRKQRVGAGPDEVVLVGLLRRSGCAAGRPRRAAAAGPDRPQPAAHVGRGHQAAVGRERVGAEDQQVVGAVDVGHRQEVPVPNISARPPAWASGRPCWPRRHCASTGRGSAPACRAGWRGCARWGCRGRRRRALRSSARIGARRSSISANASSQLASRKPPPVADQRACAAGRDPRAGLAGSSPWGR